MSVTTNAKPISSKAKNQASAERNRQIKDQAKQGASTAAISLQFGITPSRVLQVLHNPTSHIATKTAKVSKAVIARPLTPENAKRASEMKRLRFEELLTLQEIADRYGITRERVRQITGNHLADVYDEEALDTARRHRNKKPRQASKKVAKKTVRRQVKKK